MEAHIGYPFVVMDTLGDWIAWTQDMLNHIWKNHNCKEKPLSQAELSQAELSQAEQKVVPKKTGAVVAPGEPYQAHQGVWYPDRCAGELFVGRCFYLGRS